MAPGTPSLSSARAICTNDALSSAWLSLWLPRLLDTGLHKDSLHQESCNKNNHFHYMNENEFTSEYGLWRHTPIMRMNSVNTYSKLSTCSSLTITPPKITLWKWLLTPTNRPKGMSHRLVLYVVSNVTTSPKYYIAAVLRFLILVSVSAWTLNTKSGSFPPI
jgi:hypothetical protein